MCNENGSPLSVFSLINIGRWVNNCIGINNRRYFLQFLIFYTIGLTYNVIFYIFDVFYVWKNRNIIIYQFIFKLINVKRAIILSLNGFLSVVFAIFGASLLFEQVNFKQLPLDQQYKVRFNYYRESI